MKYEVKVTFDLPDAALDQVAEVLNNIDPSFSQVPENERSAAVLNTLLTTLLARMAHSYGNDPTTENFYDGFETEDKFNFTREDVSFKGSARITVNKVD